MTQLPSVERWTLLPFWCFPALTCFLFFGTCYFRNLYLIFFASVETFSVFVFVFVTVPDVGLVCDDGYLLSERFLMRRQQQQQQVQSTAAPACEPPCAPFTSIKNTGHDVHTAVLAKQQKHLRNHHTNPQDIEVTCEAALEGKNVNSSPGVGAKRSRHIKADKKPERGLYKLLPQQATQNTSKY